MQVWVYPEKQREEFGATRYEIESVIMRPEAIKRVEANEARGEYDEYDLDADTQYLVEYRKTKDAAMRRAQEIYNRDTKLGRSAFGVVTVQKQVVDWYVEEKRIAEWANVDSDHEDISGEADYEEWKNEQKAA